jgi:hypothetical protein
MASAENSMSHRIERKGDWMQTATGGMYWPVDPHWSEVNIVDIALSLSKLCRFGGHCGPDLYSVAEHSVLVSHCVPEEFAMQALLHDATEAYCMDIPRPLKKHIEGYAVIEERNWKAIALKFNLPYVLDKSVKTADNAVLAAEKQRVMVKARKWHMEDEIVPAMVPIRCLQPHAAAVYFLTRYYGILEARKTRM